MFGEHLDGGMTKLEYKYVVFLENYFQAWVRKNLT